MDAHVGSTDAHIGSMDARRCGSSRNVAVLGVFFAVIRAYIAVLDTSIAA
jgi:hypothetical protein